MYPMMADIYYPVITQTDYGQATKKWVLDRTIILNATPVGGAGQEDIKPEIFLQYENKLVSRGKRRSKNVNKQWQQCYYKYTYCKY